MYLILNLIVEGKLFIYASKTDLIAIKIILANINQIKVAGKKLANKISTGNFI